MILKVKKGQNPYYVIERYIYEHTEVLEDMIAVLEIDGVRTNELLEVDSYYDGWIWVNDWWEGEPEVSLIDFFPVSEACNPKTSISIDWLSNIAKLCKKHNDIYVQNYGMVIEILIKGWKEEREKQK